MEKTGGDIITVWNGHLVTHLYKSRALQHKPGRRQLMDLRERERERALYSGLELMTILGHQPAGFSQHIGFVT